MTNAIQAIGKLDTLPAVHKQGSAAEVTEDFGRFLSNALENLRDSQTTVHRLNEEYLRGELQDTHNLMIASQKALLGMELTVQVRNKVVEAYQEIMRIQI